MLIIKNKKRKKRALLIINIRKEYREYYDQKLNEYKIEQGEKIESLTKEHEDKIEELNHFFEKNLRKQKVNIEKKYKTLLNEKDEKIYDLEKKINSNKELFIYIKEREQDLDNIMNIIGTKFKGFAELVANGYASIQNSFTQVDGYGGYNTKHLKNDQKIINAMDE